MVKKQAKNTLRSYAKKALQLKNLTVNEQSVLRTEGVLRSSFDRNYNAVALDIDGTITDGSSREISSDILVLLKQMLVKGVCVFVVTGRGKSIKVKLAEYFADLPFRYMLNLYCIAYNGSVLMSTSNNSYNRILDDITKLTDIDKRELQELAKNCNQELIRQGLDNYSVDLTEYTVRVITDLNDDEHSIMAMFRKLKKVVKTCCSARELHVTYGKYSTKVVFDVSTTTKLQSLKKALPRAKVSFSRTLCIGDQGKRGGNDWDLLNHSCGFSASQISNSPVGCFPVLDDSHTEQLTGSVATDQLLKLARLSPNISIHPSFIDHQYETAYREFEMLASKCSTEENEALNMRLRVRLRHIIKQDINYDIFTFSLDDLYDAFSGGVRFKDWEVSHAKPRVLDSLGDQDVFGLHTSLDPESDSSKVQLYTFSDTSIVIRGSLYYPNECESAVEYSMSRYLRESSKFINDSIDMLETLRKKDPTVFTFKLCLAVIDNVRNFILTRINGFHLAYCQSKKSTDKEHLSELYLLLQEHSLRHYWFLFDSDSIWDLTIGDQVSIMRRFSNLIEHSDKRLRNLDRSYAMFKKMTKWRESDSFVQNVVAAKIMWQGLRMSVADVDQKLHVVCIASGGNELGAIVHAVASVHNYSIITSLLQLSHYGGKKKKKKRDGLDSTRLLDWETALTTMSKSSDDLHKIPVLLCDDNITSGVTLDVANEYLVANSYKVIGIMVVRYAGSNRLNHMKIKQHGAPNTDMLFSYIRGLVCQSPYTRLTRKRNNSKKYLDHKNEFDKSRVRVKHMLKRTLRTA